MATKDIAEQCDTELLGSGEKYAESPYVFDLQGPREYSSLDVQKAFAEAAGKEIEVRPVQKSELLGFYASVFPPETAKEMAQMNYSFLEGGLLYENPNPTGVTRRGTTELVDVLKELYASVA